jgi:ribosome maturation factor RimP
MESKVLDLLDIKLKDTPYFCVDVKSVEDGNKIQILLDGDDGIDIDKCAEISRYLLHAFEDTNLNPGILVSSPGLDRPLSTLRQFRKNVGRNLSVHTVNDVALTGKLVFINDEYLIIAEKIGKKGMNKHKVLLKEIEKALVVI